MKHNWTTDETTQPEYSRTWATWTDPAVMYFSGL